MKHLSAKSTFGTILSIFLLASCIKKDPEFKSAFKDVDPNLFTMNYTMKTNNDGSTPKILSNVAVHPEALKPVSGIGKPPVSCRVVNLKVKSR